MITDNGLRLATAEVVPNAGAAPGGIGDDTETLNLDLSAVTPDIRNYFDVGAGQRLQLAINVDTAFTCGTFDATLEIQLVTMPISLALLTDCGSGEGKQRVKTGVATTIASNTFTINGHGLAPGTPFFLTSLVTTTGIAENTIYYAVLDTANTFKAATSLAFALAGTPIVNMLTNNGTATVNFIPTVHASTGTIRLFDTPTDKSPLQLGERLIVPLKSVATRTPKTLLQGAETRRVTVGAGPGANLIAAGAQRYLALNYIPSATITAGAITADLVVDAGEGLTYPASAFQVIG